AIRYCEAGEQAEVRRRAVLHDLGDNVMRPTNVLRARRHRPILRPRDPRVATRAQRGDDPGALHLDHADVVDRHHRTVATPSRRTRSVSPPSRRSVTPSSLAHDECSGTLRGRAMPSDSQQLRRAPRCARKKAVRMYDPGSVGLTHVAESDGSLVGGAAVEDNDVVGATRPYVDEVRWRFLRRYITVTFPLGALITVFYGLWVPLMPNTSRLGAIALNSLLFVVYGGAFIVIF